MLEGYHPRFVDAVVWAEAACRAMGFEPGEFTEAYKGNQLVAFRYIGENDPICVGIRKLMASQKSWRGYPSELHTAIRRYTDGLGLPDPNWLARRLPYVIPVLRKLYELEVTMNKRLEQDDNRNGIIIEKVGVGRGTHFLAQLEAKPEPAPPTAIVRVRRI